MNVLRKASFSECFVDTEKRSRGRFHLLFGLPFFEMVRRGLLSPFRLRCVRAMHLSASGVAQACNFASF